MTSKEHWPHNRWHPAYDSFKDWLDNEAPADTGGARQPRRRQKNRRRR